MAICWSINQSFSLIVLINCSRFIQSTVDLWICDVSTLFSLASGSSFKTTFVQIWNGYLWNIEKNLNITGRVGWVNNKKMMVLTVKMENCVEIVKTLKMMKRRKNKTRLMITKWESWLPFDDIWALDLRGDCHLLLSLLLCQ